MILDLTITEQPDFSLRENIELAISFAATLVSEISKRGGCDILFAIIGKENEFVFGHIGIQILESILYKLAVAAPIIHTSKTTCETLAQTLIRAAATIDPRGEIILVTPKPINLDNLGPDARLRSIIQRIKVVDASDTELATYFSFQQ